MATTVASITLEELDEAIMQFSSQMSFIRKDNLIPKLRDFLEHWLSDKKVLNVEPNAQSNQLTPAQQIRLSLLVELKEGEAIARIIDNAKFDPKRTEQEFMVSRFQTLEALTQWILEGRVPDLEQPNHCTAHKAQTNSADLLSSAQTQQST